MSAPEMPEAERSELREAAQTTLRTLLEAAGAEGDVAVLLGPPAEALVDHATKIGASLVVVATHGRTGLSRITLGSVAEGVAKHAPCSVLAVRRSPAH
jgi:nucleotide-binding universal stress UspA family protein